MTFHIESLFGFLLGSSMKAHLSPQHVSTVVNSLSILNCVISRLSPRRDLLGREHSTESFKSCMKIVLTQLPFLVSTLTNTNKTLQVSIVEVPAFGFHRIALLEFFQTLLKTRSPEIFQEFVKLNIFEICLKLLTTYQWNNFVHSNVASMITIVMQGNNMQFKLWLLDGLKLPDKLLEMLKQDRESKAKLRGVRLGYMAHLNQIAREVAREQNAAFVQRLEVNDSWKLFVDAELTRANEVELRKPDTPTNVGGLQRWIQDHMKPK